MISRVFFWRLMTIVWAGHIFWMSTASFASAQSKPLLAQILVFVHLSVSVHTLDLLHAISRKSAHFIEYAILTILICWSVGGRERIRSQPFMALWCFGLAAAYSLTDELHQWFVVGRQASLIDCCIDATGAAIVLLLILSPQDMVARSGKIAVP